MKDSVPSLGMEGVWLQVVTDVSTSVHCMRTLFDTVDIICNDYWILWILFERHSLGMEGGWLQVVTDGITSVRTLFDTVDVICHDYWILSLGMETG